MQVGGYAGKRDGALLGVLLAVLVVSDLWLLRTTGWARLLGGVISYGAIAGIYWRARLRPSDIGLGRESIKIGLKWSAYVLTIAFIGSFVAYMIAPASFRDPRYHQSILAALYTVLVLLPLKTVLFEELAFRGLLATLLCKIINRRWAIIGSAVAFGLWHVPTALGVEQSLQNNQLALSNTATIVIVFVLTTAAGALLTYLRFKSSSLLVSLTVHWALNASGIIIAALVWK